MERKFGLVERLGGVGWSTGDNCILSYHTPYHAHTLQQHSPRYRQRKNTLMRHGRQMTPSWKAAKKKPDRGKYEKSEIGEGGAGG